MLDNSPAPMSIDPQAGPRERIVAAGVKLVTEQGVDAATTRAVALAASVQPPTIFRHFGDKEGLLDAISDRMMSDFLARKSRHAASGDPVEDLRLGMEVFMAFGVDNPDIFIHLFGRPGRLPKAAVRGLDTVRRNVQKAALTGRLAVSEQRAVDIINGLSRGTVMAMLERSEECRRGMISGAGDAALAAILTGEAPSPDAGSRSAAALLRAHLSGVGALTPGERLLLSELLGRIADNGSTAQGG